MCLCCSLFDDYIEKYDVYKVEIIGDVYLVVSGFFIWNGDNYVGEIVLMLFKFLFVILFFKIKYRFDDILKLCIGIYLGKFRIWVLL